LLAYLRWGSYFLPGNDKVVVVLMVQHAYKSYGKEVAVVFITWCR